MNLVDRLESAEQIRQLVARYAVAYDARDAETLASIWAPDVREAQLAIIIPRLTPTRSFHLVTPPALRFLSDDEAQGESVIRAEAERGDEWIVAGGVYADTFVRIDGVWYLSARTFTAAYSGDVLSIPS